MAAILFSSLRLSDLPKPNGDVKPIAIGESIRRLTARTIYLFTKKEEFTEIFCPIQHGVSTKCGRELIAHHMCLTLESNPNWIVLNSDVKDALYSFSRDQIVEQASRTFPDLYNHVIQMYGKPSSLVFMQQIPLW